MGSLIASVEADFDVSDLCPKVAPLFFLLLASANSLGLEISPANSSSCQTATTTTTFVG